MGLEAAFRVVEDPSPAIIATCAPARSYIRHRLVTKQRYGAPLYIHRGDLIQILFDVP